MPIFTRNNGRKVIPALILLAGLFTALNGWSAVLVPRYGLVAALLPDGRTFIAGGSNASDTPVNTTEILDTTKGSEFVSPAAITAAASMAFARSSATITVLPNGNVLVTGGWDGTNARSDAEVYTPRTDSWVTVSGMSIGRFNHTATLLNTGNVLVCGGQTGAAAAVTATCDLFTPAGTGGSFSGTGSLLLARSLHSSTLLNDGTVWIAGGWNPGTASGGWIVTTERYSPVSGQWQQAQPLNAARAYHTATFTGDNKVLVVGGFNGRDIFDTIGYPTKGYLATSEVFDPTGGAIVPGPPMNARVQAHTATLQPDGEVSIFGGIGNIPTTQLTSSLVEPKFSSFSYVSGTTTGAANGYRDYVSTAGAGSVPIKFFLGTEVTGRIMDGEVHFVSTAPNYNSPRASINGALIYFLPVPSTSSASGLRASLRGANVGCDETGKCGLVQTTLNLQNMSQGSYHIETPTSKTQLLPNQAISGSLTFSPSPLTKVTNSGVATISNGNVTTRVQLSVPDFLEGQSISDVVLTLTPENTLTWAETSTYTVTLNAGSATGAGPYPVIKAGSVTYIDIPSITFTSVRGTIQNTGDTSLTSPLTIPIVAAVVNNLSASMDFTATGIKLGNLGGATLLFDAMNIVINKMTFSDQEWYVPNTSQWSFIPGNGGSTPRPFSETVGGTTVLTPGNELFNIGGKRCSTDCSSLVASASSGNRIDTMLVWSNNNFTAGGTSDPLSHAFHSATLLSNGTILLAGGTDGNTVLKSAEIYDPTSGAFSTTNTGLQLPRQKHSASLLPNGRVLIAGGFTTTATSTGPTNTAEIYYPDTKVFLPTSVMSSSHSQHAAVGLPNGNIFVAGGFKGLTTVTDVAEIYYSTSGVWSPVASLPSGQERAIAASVLLKDGRIVLFGGTNQTGNLNSVIAYNPATNSWSSLTAMPLALQGHTATLLLDGRVLIAGGDDGFGETSSSYIYDPITDTWLTTNNSLREARFGHSATLLPNGTVMITGGVKQTAPIPGSPANALSRVELFHPAAYFWNSPNDAEGNPTFKFLLGPRSFHTTTLAPNGNLYFFGGANGSIGTGQATSFYSQFEVNYFTAPPDLYSRTSPSVRQSTITTVTTSPFLPNTSFTATGLRFRGGSEASGGGAASANSSFNTPRLLLQKMSGTDGGGAESAAGFIVDMTTYIYANSANLTTLDTNFVVQLPANNVGLPYGWYMTWIGANDVHSVKAPLVQVGPAKPTTAVTNIVGTPLGISSITYSWTGVGGIDGYNIYSATNGVFITTVSAATPNYVQDNLAPNATAGIIIAGYTMSGDGPLAYSTTYFTYSTAPINVSIASVTFNSLMLQWDPNGNVIGTIYEINQSTDGFITSFSTPVPTIIGLTTNQYTITQLQENTTYFYRVRAVSAAGIPSLFSATVSTLTRTSVSTLQGVALSATSIQWNWPPSGAVINYKVYNSTSGEVIASPVSNSYTDTGLGINSQRSVMVSAVTAAGEGPLSSGASAYTFAAVPGSVTPPITALSTGSFTVQWTFNGNPNGTTYNVNVHSLDGVSTVSTQTTTGFFSSFGGLNASSRYSVYIYAINGDGLSSSPLIIGSTYTLATPPTGLQVLGTTPVTISLSWSGNSNSTNTYYQVTYSTDNFVLSVATSIPFSSGYNSSTATVTGLITSTTYWLRVQARNANGQLTSFSNTVTTITYNGGGPAGSLAGILTAIGQSGFSGTLVNGRTISVRSPGGSFPSDTFVVISSYDVTTPLCTGGINVAVSITASPYFQPQVPIFLTASYSPSEVGSISPTELALERYEPASGTCVPLETTFNTSQQTFTAQLNHFSLYQLVQVPLATETGTARIFPNPFQVGVHGYVTIDKIPPGSRVRIMTLRGETVMDTLSSSIGLLTWSGTNGAGRPVASGLYLVVIEHGGSKKITKMAVIR